MKLRTPALLSILAITAPLSLADTLTVGPNLNDYDFITITAAIAGSASGDEIVIQPGLYPENLLISNKDLTLRSAGGGGVTVFGQGLDKCLRTSGASTDVDVFGITFTNGSSPSSGGGVSIEGGSRANLTDCIIENSTGPVGGGLYMSGGGTITNTIIRNNTATGNGGGVYLNSTSHKSFVGCTFEGNTGVEGGGLAYATIGDIADFTDCSFVSNTATNRGGAIAVLGGASFGLVDVADCVFTMNHADNAGGAVWVSDADVFRALNSVFDHNTAMNIGGVMRNEQFFEAINCTFVGNDVIAAGVADSFESNRSDSQTKLLNCIVVNASAASETGPGALLASYSLIPEGPMGAANASGNFNADPMFVDASSGDYTLAAGSPAIDAGNSRGSQGGVNYGFVDVLDVASDLAGNVRNLDDPDTDNTGLSTWELCIDLGAFEFQPEQAASCTADLNNDGVLNFFDVSAFISAYNAGCP